MKITKYLDKLGNKQLKHELLLYQTMVNASPESITLIDKNYRYCLVNDAYIKARHLKKEEILNNTVASVWGKEVFEQIIKEKLDDCFKGKTVSHISAYEFKKNKIDYIDTTYTPCFITGQTVAYSVVVSINVTELKESQEQVKFLAYYDPVTSLPGRPLFKEHLQHEIKNAERNGKVLAVFILDLDEFKKINATFGHSAGDELLLRVSNRLVKYLRKSDTIGRPGGVISSVESTTAGHFSRIGGDEFTLIIPNLSNRKNSADFAEKIINLFKKPFKIADKEVLISPSIGIAICPDDGNSVEDLLKNADAAMYRAKKVGKNTFRYYSPEMNQQAKQHSVLERKMQYAIKNQEFKLYYQPQYNIHTSQLVGMEALIRWEDPDVGLVSPGDFIPLAEKTGMIIPIGEWVIQAACQQAKIWHEQGFRNLHIGANLSMRQFFDPHLVDTIKSAIGKTGFNPNFLELDITETAMMHDTDRAIDILNELKGIGIKISLDDFGTGYSSLIHLKNFHTDTLKIDQNFIRKADMEGRDGAIITAIIDMCYSLGIKVIAEGVENNDSLDFLKKKSCHIAQGFLLSPPLPVEEFQKLLEGATSRRA